MPDLQTLKIVRFAVVNTGKESFSFIDNWMAMFIYSSNLTILSTCENTLITG